MDAFRKPLTAEVVDSIRGMLAAGAFERGSYLPPERELVRRFSVSRVTVRRALGQLVAEGLIESVPHQGYRPAARRAGSSAGGAVAYVLAQAEPDQVWDFTHEQIITALSRRLMEIGRHALAVGSKGRPAAEVFAELRSGAAWGVVLDTSLPEYVDAAAASGLPWVVIDAHTDRPDADIVIQDNFGGARRAVEYLLAKGHERIGWVGPVRGTAHSRERFAGARAALNDAGRDFAAELVAEAPSHDATDAATELAAGLLRLRQRPTALVCMWREMAMGAARALREAGLVQGRDVEIAAWATEREYREVLAPEFLGGPVPAAAVWRPEEMAALAVQRLERRAADRWEPACRTSVRVRLVEPASAETVLRNGPRRGGGR
jgi:DNA-binding LacI/PurR family transcriptional regulator